jgi:small subunit ribosomal protein S5
MFLATTKAVEDAKKNLVKFLEWSICSSRTKGKFGGARVFLIPASHGTELLLVSCSFSFESVGIHDVLSKSQGSSNHNVVKATLMLCYK